VSVEDDQEWHQKVRRELSATSLETCELVLLPVDRFPQFIDGLSPESFDLVLVDCNETETVSRMSCVDSALRVVKPGGLLLLDDSDRLAYRGQDRLLGQWQLRRFVGVKSFPLMAVETSIYRRPPERGAMG
jgi:predicted O-methyltransferase YrrM